jgi:prepilin-type N-terminal cleavage/methylation domain-containing protein
MRSLRSGHTLVEVVVVLALLGVLTGALWRVLDRQHRLYHALGQVIDGRSQLAQGAAVVASELRAASSSGGDLRALTDSSFTTRTSLGTAILCGITSPTDVELAPARVARGAQLASFVSTPHPGDTVVVFDEGASLAAHDDRWHVAEIASIGTPTTSCAGPIVDPVADAGASGWRVRLTGSALPPTVTVGAPVRVTRPIRVALYQSSGEDYLGVSDWNPASGTWNVIQPVAGPFASPTGLSSSVGFEYRDSLGTVLGAPVASTTSVALVRARAIATTAHVVRADGMRRGHYSDTLTLAVELRNRK